MSFTYAQLKQAIIDYTQNEETTFQANLPLFIRLTEERILKNIRLNLFQKNVTGTTTLGNQYLAAPSDFLTPISCSVQVSGNKEFLLFKTPDFIQSYNPDPTVTGVPKYFASYDVNDFILAPTPAAAYTVELHYLYRPASLTAGAESGTTWLSINAPQAMLYGALFEAYTFNKGEADLLELYAARFAEASARMKDFGEGKEPTTEYRLNRVTIQRT